MNELGLLTPSVGYKPFRYPIFYDYWLKQQRVHWLADEVPMGGDIEDWNSKLTSHEKSLLTQIFRFFTEADIEVQDCYHEKYSSVFKPTEVKMMLAAFSNTETIHIQAYSHLIDTLGMPEDTYSSFLKYKEMRDKHEYAQQFGMESPEDILTTMAMFGGFTEGVQLFASFAMLLNFPRFNKMKGMGQIISWSVRDESLHCEGIIRLFHEFARESGALTEKVKKNILSHAEEVVRMEDAFIDLAFEQGPITGMEPVDIKRYVRFITDWRLTQLGLPPIYQIKEHPLPWLAPLLNGVEHSNFFEARATEYSKGATKGTWQDTWSKFNDIS